MALKAITTLKSEAYTQVRAIARQIKKRADIIIPLMDSNISRDNILEYGVSLETQFNILNSLETFDLEQLAKDQEEDQTYSFSTEYASMKTAIINVLTEIRTQYPTSAGGFLATKTFLSGTSLAIVDGEFTPAQVSNLKALIQTLSNSIL